MRKPLSKKNLRDPKYCFLLFWLFLSEILSRLTTDADVDSRAQQAILLKKVKKNQAKIAFFLFFRRKLWHDFVTPFSTFANIKGSLPTKSTTPDRLRWRTKRFSPFSANYFLENRQKKDFFKGPSSSCDLASTVVHPKRSP